ncbi:MAG: hypothetical protein SV062_07985 [Thermodesulfobacteriota bacterium]|nr:hypothetical protein [Thermodesulfobacteriota bacterium]
MIKLRGWEMALVRKIALPILRKVSGTLKEKAEATPETWDDVLAGAFDTVVSFLEAPDTFGET